jgi:hypothetical protein
MPCPAFIVAFFSAAKDAKETGMKKIWKDERRQWKATGGYSSSDMEGAFLLVGFKPGTASYIQGGHTHLPSLIVGVA